MGIMRLPSSRGREEKKGRGRGRNAKTTSAQECSEGHGGTEGKESKSAVPTGEKKARRRRKKNQRIESLKSWGLRRGNIMSNKQPTGKRAKSEVGSKLLATERGTTVNGRKSKWVVKAGKKPGLSDTCKGKRELGGRSLGCESFTDWGIDRTRRGRGVNHF